MAVNNKNLNKIYDRVMPRVSTHGRPTLKSSSFVTRHDIPSSARLGAKPSVSNVSSTIYSELPKVLIDYVPEPSRDQVRRKFVVKPRKTLRSLDPATSPHRHKIIPKVLSKTPTNIQTVDSAPSVLPSTGGKWSETHLRECLSSTSHSRLKEIKDEIQAYHKTEKLIRIRSNLYKKCGVVLDDVGNVAADKAVQVGNLPASAEDVPQTDIR